MHDTHVGRNLVWGVALCVENAFINLPLSVAPSTHILRTR